MKLLGFAEPRIAVCGLNPHAGEHGLFGDEDARVIAPGDSRRRATPGSACSGPHAADTVFLQAVARRVRSGGRDVSRPGPHPDEADRLRRHVNISLGIPIIRTSVDHGTAFDIAGQGQADARSMKQAMRFAVRMAATRRASL